MKERAGKSEAEGEGEGEREKWKTNGSKASSKDS